MITPSESALERAQNIIDEKRITLVPEQAGWMVMGSNGTLRTVQLFKDGVRSPTCSCKSTTTCCHILAAMQSIDCVFLNGKKGNTTSLRKQTRSRAQKQLGKKKSMRLPRANTGNSFACTLNIDPQSNCDDTGGLPSDDDNDFIEQPLPKQRVYISKAYVIQFLFSC